MANLLERRNMMMPLSYNWLGKYALQVISTAFGYPECTFIIRATNDYLDGIAATDLTKAQALVVFINDTPTIAPWICGYYEPSEDYPLYATEMFRSTYTSKSNTSIRAICRYSTYDSSNWRAALIGGLSIDEHSMYFGSTGDRFRFGFSATSYDSPSAIFYQSSVGNKYTISVTQRAASISRNSYTLFCSTASSWYGYTLNIYGSDWWRFCCFSIKEGADEVHRYFALTDGKVWDYITEEFYLPDGTIWTPGT